MLATAAGLTRGRPAVTHHGAIEDLRRWRPGGGGQGWSTTATWKRRRGHPSGIDMALWLVERVLGAELAEAVAAEIEHPRHGEVWRS